mgnify:CR=1 FL=1
MRAELDKVIGEMSRILSQDLPFLDQITAHLMGMRGKLFRPTIVLLASRSAGRSEERATTLAATVELIHLATLVHDDAIDHSVLRRGMPTSHVKFGEDVAILAGDALFAEAMRLIAERQGGRPEAILRAIREIAAATGVDGMVGGQYVDVTGGGTDAGSLRRLHSLKTGRLIAASVGAALVLAGVDGERAGPYRRFAAELGVLFQIVDDILDVTGSDEELGKPSGSDQRHGKVTYVSLFGLDRARELARVSHEGAREALAGAEGNVDDLGRIADFIFTRDT